MHELNETFPQTEMLSRSGSPTITCAVKTEVACQATLARDPGQEKHKIHGEKALHSFLRLTDAE